MILLNVLLSVLSAAYGVFNDDNDDDCQIIPRDIQNAVGLLLLHGSLSTNS